MGDLVAMQRKINVSVSRFGRVFALEWKAGRTPRMCEPAATLTVNGEFLAWCAIAFHDPDDWSEVYVSLSDDYRLLHPNDLGISESTEDDMDFHFLAEAEDYVMGLINEALAQKLSDTAREPGAEDEEPSEENDPLALTPLDRGKRVVSVWHNHGERKDQLPDLISIELYDALQCVGLALGDVLDADQGVPRDQCGAHVRETVAEALETWRAADLESD